jgi:hypothetical protein
MKDSYIIRLWKWIKREQDYVEVPGISIRDFKRDLIKSPEFQAALPVSSGLRNVLHLELLNRGSDFPLQTIYQPTKAGNYLIVIGGMDWLGQNNIGLSLTAVFLGGGVTGTNGNLNSPTGNPCMSIMNDGQLCLDGIAPVQMSIINSDPTYAGGTQTYTVCLDIVKLG